MGGAFAVADTAECDMSSNTHWSHDHVYQCCSNLARKFDQNFGLKDTNL